MIMYTELNYFINIIWKIYKSKYIIVKKLYWYVSKLAVSSWIHWVSFIKFTKFLIFFSIIALCSILYSCDTVSSFVLRVYLKSLLGWFSECSIEMYEVSSFIIFDFLARFHIYLPKISYIYEDCGSFSYYSTVLS